jgi:hypothetical protein
MLMGEPVIGPNRQELIVKSHSRFFDIVGSGRSRAVHAAGENQVKAGVVLAAIV